MKETKKITNKVANEIKKNNFFSSFKKKYFIRTTVKIEDIELIIKETFSIELSDNNNPGNCAKKYKINK